MSSSKHTPNNDYDNGFNFHAIAFIGYDNSSRFRSANETTSSSSSSSDSSSGGGTSGGGGGSVAF
ncbi:hypothetical protein E2R56_19420 [Rhodococcus qingshengii]|nr:hypothetical protein E2R56_19420 [Rhodococcus qingshengii]